MFYKYYRDNKKYKYKKYLYIFYMTEFNNLINQFDKIITKYNISSDSAVFTDINNIINKLNLLNNKFIIKESISNEPLDQLIDKLNNQDYNIDSFINILLIDLPNETIENKKTAINKIENVLSNNIFNNNIVYKLTELIKLYKNSSNKS